MSTFDPRPIVVDRTLSEAERMILDKYIRTRPLAISGSNDEHATLRLIVGGQEFVVNEMPLKMMAPMTVEETEWSGVQLAMALARMVEELTKGTP